MPISNPITHPSIHPSQCHLPIVHNLSILTSIHSSTIHSSTYICIYLSVHLLIICSPAFLPSVYQSFHSFKHPSIPLPSIFPFVHYLQFILSSAHHPSITPTHVELLDHLSINLTPPTCPLIYDLYLLYLFSGLSIYHAVYLVIHLSIIHPFIIWLFIPLLRHLCTVPHSPFTC